jgi:hypothetical protein
LDQRLKKTSNISICINALAINCILQGLFSCITAIYKSLAHS